VRFLILSLLLAAPNAAAKPCANTKSGPCTPNKKVQGQILAHIKKGLDFHPIWKNLEAEEKILRDGLRDGIFRDRDKKRAEWKGKYIKMMAAKDATIGEFNKALDLTNNSYRLEQVGSNKTITGGPFDGYKPSRKLEFLATDGYYGYAGEGDNRKRLFNPMETIDRAKAITFRNGARVFKVEAFQEAYNNKNAGILAGTIFHEGTHQRDLVDGKFIEKERTEERAYKAVMDRAEIFGIDRKGAAQVSVARAFAPRENRIFAKIMKNKVLFTSRARCKKYLFFKYFSKNPISGAGAAALADFLGYPPDRPGRLQALQRPPRAAQRARITMRGHRCLGLPKGPFFFGSYAISRRPIRLRG